MSKTIKQIADELGVSKTAVRKKITPQIANQFIETIGNTVYISKDGETLIKSAFKNPIEKQVSSNQTQTVSTLVFMLQTELETLHQQLKAKDIQIEKLTSTIKLQAESINTDRKNELAGTIIDGQQKIIEHEAKENKRLKRLKQFFKGE